MQRQLILALLLLAACKETPNAGPASAPDAGPYAGLDVSAMPTISSSAATAAEAAIRAEPKVIDLVYDPRAVVQWTVGGRDDGTQRFGYAEYICSTLQNAGALAQGTQVRIVNYASYMASEGDAQSASLGRVECDGLRHLTP